MKLIKAPTVADLVLALSQAEARGQWNANEDGCVYIGSRDHHKAICISPTGHTDFPEYVDNNEADGLIPGDGPTKRKQK